MNMKSDDVLKFEDDLRNVESELYILKNKICDIKGSSSCLENIDKSIEYIRYAINNVYYMDELQN